MGTWLLYAPRFSSARKKSADASLKTNSYCSWRLPMEIGHFSPLPEILETLLGRVVQNEPENTSAAEDVNPLVPSVPKPAKVLYFTSSFLTIDSESVIQPFCTNWVTEQRRAHYVFKRYRGGGSYHWLYSPMLKKICFYHPLITKRHRSKKKRSVWLLFSGMVSKKGKNIRRERNAAHCGASFFRDTTLFVPLKIITLPAGQTTVCSCLGTASRFWLFILLKFLFCCPGLTFFMVNPLGKVVNGPAV